MKVTVELHSGDKHTYEEADHVSDKDKFSIYIYDIDNRILAIFNKSDIKNLVTEN